MSTSEPRSERIPGPLEIARLLHRHAAREQRGLLVVEGRSASNAGPRRLLLREGFVVGIDAGSGAPVSPEAQLRYILRLRGRPSFVEGETLSARFSVPPFRPDAGIRQHIDAQEMAHEPLRQRIGAQQLGVALPPHTSALAPDEQAVVEFLAASPRTVVELLQAPGWSPLRALRLLVVLDALGSLVVGTSGAVAEALAVLGLGPGASPEEIKSAYRTRARQLHPDHHPAATPEQHRRLTEQFAALHAAYRRLTKT